MPDMRFAVLAALFCLSACRGGSDPAVAKVGRLAISRSEFDRKLSDVSAGYQGYIKTPGGRRQFLDVLIREKLMLGAAMESTAASSPVFKQEYERLRAEQEQTLREQRDDLLTRLWLDGLRQQGILSVSADEAREYHRKYPTEVGISHILMASPEETEAVAKLARGGQSFAALAKSRSLDYETAAEGGKMPPAIYGEIIPDIEDVAFRMRVGDVTGPFKSKFGYHVLRKDYERKLPFEACQDRVMALLEKQKLDKYLQSIEPKFPVEVVDEQLR